MGHQIIQQPDGRLAVWSTVVDDWVLVDATAEELAAHFGHEERVKVQTAVRAQCEAVLTGDARSVYFQFAMTFEEAQAARAARHGSAPWPPEELDSAWETGDADDGQALLRWDYRYVTRYDEENAPTFRALLAEGWEPFAAEHQPGGVSRIHLKRPVQ